MSRIIRETKSKEEQLNELIQKLKEEQYKYPLAFNEQMANLSIRIIRLKRSMGISTPDEKYQLIDMMLYYAFHMKTSKRDRHVAKNTFTQILKLDPDNSVANYRYAFLQYEDRNWIKAINHFQRAIQYVDLDFSLEEDQIIKANLFIGYCSVMLAKESIAKADNLSREDVETPPGEIGIDELTRRLKTELDSTKYLLITNNEKKFISEEEYEELESSIDGNSLLLDFTTEEPLVQSGKESSDISFQLANILKRLLLNPALSWAEVTVYQEDVSDHMDITWDNYRTIISRIRKKLKKVGLPDNLIENIPKRNSYKMSNINYYIVQYDAK